MTAKIIVAPGAEATLALAQRFLHAINTRNAVALLETMAQDVVYDLRVAPATPVRGLASIGEALAALAATWPDYDFVVHTIRADATLFVADWTMTGTLAQPLPIGNRTAVPDGRSISFDGVDICPVTGGKVTAKISYIDATAWYDKLTFAPNAV